MNLYRYVLLVGVGVHVYVLYVCVYKYGCVCMHVYLCSLFITDVLCNFIYLVGSVEQINYISRMHVLFLLALYITFSNNYDFCWKCFVDINNCIYT